MWNTVVNLFRQYMGTGLAVIFFLLSLIYLFIKEKRKPVRILFIYVPLILLFLFFNPLFARIVYGVAGDEIYYRILWLIPITPVIAFAAVSICGELSGKKKAAFVLAAACILTASGSYIYGNPYFHRAENPYHMPDSVVHICDAIVVPGREVRAVFPVEMLQYVRQYEPVICMPYGREMTVERWSYFENPLFDEMEKEKADLSALAPLVREGVCHYVILPQEKEIIGNPADYGWELFETIDGYVIYRDTGLSLEF